MKTIKLKCHLLAALLIASFMVSCERNDVENVDIQLQQKVEEFSTSQVFIEFSKNFPFESGLINFDKIVLNQTTPTVQTIHLPIEQKGKLIGRLVGFPIPEKGGYQLIYESYEEFDGRNGLIKQYTSKGNFIADFKVVDKGNNMASYSLNTIGNKFDRINLVAGTQAALPPVEGDGWWGCTTNCYKQAKEACGSDTTCDFMCDLVDIMGQCTISMAAACAIYCV